MNRIRSVILLILFFIIGLFTAICFNEVFGNYVFERPSGELLDYGYTKGFSTDGYYCVITKGEGSDQIRSFDYHEACHQLLRYDYSHYCKR